MEIRVDYKTEIETDIRDQIEFIREEFAQLFGDKVSFTLNDKKIAMDLLNHLSKIIDTPVCLEFLSHTLEHLENKYPTLF